MITKLLLLLALLLLTNKTSSVISKGILKAVPSEVSGSKQNVKEVKSPAQHDDVTWTERLPHEGDKHAEKAPKQSEDGKHHHFHFSRIPITHRRRTLLLVASKLLLVIMHICCFIYCFMHVFH